MITNQQIADFNQKRPGQPTADVPVKPSHLIEESIRPVFESHYKAVSNEDWNSPKNSRSLALLCSLATYLKRCDMKKCGNIPLEKIPKFLDREPKRLLAMLQRATPMKKVSRTKRGERSFAQRRRPFRSRSISSTSISSPARLSVSSATSHSGESTVKDTSADVGRSLGLRFDLIGFVFRLSAGLPSRVRSQQ